METGQRVVIGIDPHKRSVTMEVMTADEMVLGSRRFGTDIAGFEAMTEFVKQWPDRVWAIEGCSGIGRHVAMRLIAEGQDVVDVPPKLSARARVFSTGQGRKTDATDAHSVALVGAKVAGLRPVVANDQLTILRMLADRRRSLGEEHTRKASQLHALLLELLPGGATKDLSAAQAKALLAKVRPRDTVGKTRRRLAAELVGDLEQIYARKKAADKELKALVAATGTGLLDLHGIGPSGAARLLVEVGDVTRFPDRNHFASWTGTAPIDVPRTGLLRQDQPPPTTPRRRPKRNPCPAHRRHSPSALPPPRPRLRHPPTNRRPSHARNHPPPKALPRPRSLQNPPRGLRRTHHLTIYRSVLRDIPQHRDVQGLLGHDPLQPGVLLLRGLQSDRLVLLQRHVLSAPPIERLLRDPELLTHLRGRRPLGLTPVG
jgi:transposase